MSGSSTITPSIYQAYDTTNTAPNANSGSSPTTGQTQLAQARQNNLVTYVFGNDPQAYYHISISGNLLWPPLVAYVPEQFTISTQAVFETRFGTGLGALSSKLATFGSALQATTGTSLVTKDMTMQTWTTSAPVEFNLLLLSHAQSNGQTEVSQPIMQLLALCLPSASDTPLSSAAADAFGADANAVGGFTSSTFSSFAGQQLLRGPGPTFAEPDRGTYTIVIGNQMVFVDMLIVSVNAELDSLVDQNGYPLSGKVDLTLRSSTVMLAEDIKQAFGF